MTHRILAFSDFSGGEYGRNSLRPPANSFTAKNMLRLIDGSLCVRAGLKDLAPTGVPNGVLRGIGWSQAATNGSPDHLWFVVGTTVYSFNGETTGDAAASYTGALAATSSYPIPHVDGVASNADRLTYISVPGDKCYRLNHNARTVTAITGDGGGRDIEVYKDRLVTIDKTTGNRIRFTAAADFTTFPAANYFDVGDGWAIAAVVARRNGLYIAKIDGSWWLVTGTLGVNESLRQIRPSQNPSDAPHEHTHVAATGDGRMWFLPAYKDYPATFDGATVSHFKHLSWGDGSTTLDALPASATVTHGQYEDEVLVVSGMTGSLTDNRAALRRNGAWTFHTFGTDVTSFIAAGPTGRFCIAKDGDGSNPAKFYVWDTNIERPPIAADSFTRTGDLSDTALDATLSLAPWWAGEGYEVQVHRVWVDFRKWNTGGASTNHFDLTVDALGVFNDDGATASSTLSWDEAGSSASTDGTNDREVLGFGDQGLGAGFQLRFANLRGIAIRAVYVEANVVPSLPVAA